MLLLVFANEMVYCFLKWKCNLMCLQQKYESITVSGGSHKFRPDPQSKTSKWKTNRAIKLGMDSLFINWKA